jgi:hypothetical protein
VTSEVKAVGFTIFHLHLSWRSLDNSVTIMIRIRAGLPEPDSRQGQGFFLVTASRPALGPTQPPTHWVSGALSPVIKWRGHEVDHSSPSSAAVNNAWKCNSTPPYVIMACCLIKEKARLHGRYLIKHRDNFIFCFFPRLKI